MAGFIDMMLQEHPEEARNLLGQLGVQLAQAQPQQTPQYRDFGTEVDVLKELEAHRKKSPPEGPYKDLPLQVEGGGVRNLWIGNPGDEPHPSPRYEYEVHPQQLPGATGPLKGWDYFKDGVYYRRVRQTPTS